MGLGAVAPAIAGVRASRRPGARGGAAAVRGTRGGMSVENGVHRPPAPVSGRAGRVPV